MAATSHLPKIPVNKIVERIFTFRQISSIDQRLLMSHLMSKDALSKTDYFQINRVVDALQRGAIGVVE